MAGHKNMIFHHHCYSKRFNAEQAFFGYLGLTINSDGALMIRSGDWQTSPDTPIITP